MLMPSIYGETLFDELFNGLSLFNDRDFKNIEKKLYGHNSDRLMSTDVKETDEGYELEMDLPGFKKEEITVSLENGYMTVSAVKGLEKSEDGKDNEKSNGHYIRRERYTGSCSRNFFVGEHLTEEDIKAEFSHGILKLYVPKIDPASRIASKKVIAIA